MENADLVHRVSDLFVDLDHEQKKMFGGVAFMHRGHMTVGVTNKGVFMARVGKERDLEYLEEAHVRPMDMTGKIMRGMLFVDDEGLRNRSDLERWVQRSLDFVNTLPEKIK